MNTKTRLIIFAVLSSSSLLWADSVDTVTKYDPRYLRAEHREGRVVGSFVDIVYEPPVSSAGATSKVVVHTDSLGATGNGAEKAALLQKVINDAKKQNPPTPLMLAFSAGSNSSDKGHYAWLVPDPLVAKVAKLEKELSLYRASCTLPEGETARHAEKH